MFASLPHWLRPRPARMHRRRPAGARPALEALEDRCAPAVLSVNTVSDNTTADSSLTLREAVSVVNSRLGRSLTTAEQAQVSGTLGSDDTIQFKLPSGAQTIALTGGALWIAKAMRISGPGASSLTLSGNNLDRVFLVGWNSAAALGISTAISGMTITGGKTGYGAGILNYSTLSVSNITFTGNTATTNGGGGLYNVGKLTVTNCTLTNNTTLNDGISSTAGGALLNSGAGTVTLTNCTFTGNTAPGTGSLAGSGGAISNSGTMTANNCTFTNNTCGSDGGAVYNNGTFTANVSTFVSNTALADGGAIRTQNYLTISSCLFSGNTASSEGGALDGTYSAALSATNCTFVNNVTGSQGGGLKLYGTNISLTNVTVTGNRVIHGTGTLFGGGILVLYPILLRNTIVAGNFRGTTSSSSGDDIWGAMDPASSYNLIGIAGNSGLVNGVNNNLVGVSNPGLGSLANNGGPSQTIALLPGSPAIDHGSNAFVPAGATDQRGLPRIANGTVDMGAFEVQPAAATASFVVSGYPSPVIAGTANTFTITAKDASGNTITGYTGTVRFTSSDPNAVLPADYTFVSGDNGTHTFSATLKTVGSQSITVTDKASPSLTGTQPGITVNPANVPATLTVNSTADDTNADGVLTLREAIAIENGTLGRTLTSGEQGQIFGTLGNKDTIQFKLPAGSQTITLTGGPLSITRPVTITGSGAANLTVSGNNQDRVFIVGAIWSRDLSLAVSISGLTIANGSAVSSSNNYGAGLLNFGTLTLSNCTLTNNNAGSSGGGGFYNVGAATVTNCTFTANVVANLGAGGAINNISSGTMTIAGCTFTGNQAAGTGSTASSGAAIATSGTMTITGSTFTGNAAASNGGAIYNKGTLTLGTSSLSNNTAGSNGGAIRSDGTLTLTASTFAGNSAASAGGALSSTDAKLTVTNCTFANNTAVSLGGAVYAGSGTGSATIRNATVTGNRVTYGSSGAFGGGLYSGRPVTVHNTILAGNFNGPAGTQTANDVAGALDTASSFNLIGTGGSGGLTNGTNSNQVGVSNAGLGALADNGGPTLTIALLSSSPAKDRGNSALVAAGETDQRGKPRVVAGSVDIGAFEVQ